MPEMKFFPENINKTINSNKQVRDKLTSKDNSSKTNTPQDTPDDFTKMNCFLSSKNET
ncbi:MAG: hypothetical protein GX308_05270 [Epulopiscium sp.]|nr:hypothetical protein [Candidatus Epulonipiscium sp.]